MPEDLTVKELEALGALTTDDTFYMLDDPGGTPVNRKVAVSVLDARYLVEANDLSDLDSAATARTNLGVAIGSDVFTQRTITGTANQVVVSNGDGVSGNPTLSTPQNIHTGATPTFAGLISSGAAGIDCNPGSDTDTDLITVGVTGTPKLWWDESLDQFQFEEGNLATRRGGDTIYPYFEIVAVTNNGYPLWNTYRARGTDSAAPSAINAWDSLGVFQNWGYHGSAYSAAAKFGYGALENWDANNRGTYMTLEQVNAGDTSVTEQFRIANSRMRIGGTNFASSTLHVDQASTTGAIPVLILDQADIDLEFIKLVGSSQDSQADRSLVDVADMTTPGALVGWFQIYVEDVQGTNPIADGVYYVPFYAAPSA